MTSDRAPVVATWLVERFCGEPAIAGDLIEEYRTRQSRLWYWRQALIAVFACSGTRIWDHKWLTLRAIATGWIFASIVIRFGMREMVHPWWDSVAPPALYPVIASLAWLANGWVIGRLHRPYSTAMVSAYALWLVVRSVSPVYAAAVDALSGVDNTLGWELWSRATSVIVMICGGLLSAYCDQLLAARRSRLTERSVGPQVSVV
jgi:hypothetical protein